MMEDFIAANKIIILRGVLCSDAILQHDYDSLIASLGNDNWAKENEIFNFSCYTWKRDFIPDLSTIVFFDEYGNISRAIHCYESNQTLRQYLRN
jgi:hypothetical protein